jgi:hypothetical protein
MTDSPYESEANEGLPTEATRAVRLIFEFSGDQVRLVSQQEVDLAVKSEGLAPIAPGALAIESRDAEDRPVQRVEVPATEQRSMEVFDETPEVPITRIPVDSGAFTVVVPVSDTVDRLAVLRAGEPGVPAAPGARKPPAPREGGNQPLEELAIFPLTA